MFKKTVDSVLADLTKKVQLLHDLAEDHYQKNTVHRVLAEYHIGLAEKAKRVAFKFEELLK
jgi:hypothetical protein